MRSAKAAQSGRIASRGTAEQFSRDRGPQQASPSAYRSAYTPGSQGRSANTAYSRQSAASQYSRNNPQYSRNANRRMSRGKKVAIGVLAAVLVAVVGCGTAFALYVNSINSELIGDMTSEEMQAIQDVLAPKKSFDEPFYMMLVGSDERAGSDEAGARSDTNIVVYVDPTRNQASIVSIPRDTMIDIDNVGISKFNAAYNYGGVSSTIREASQLLGVDISHYAEVNFENMVQLVDAVGGVDVEVTERIDDTDADNTTDNPNGKRIIIEHFDLIYPLLGVNANLLIGVGEQIVITRPNLFGPLPQELCDIVYPSLAYRLMAHSAEDLCEYAMTQEQMLACSHGDIRHGFVLEFNEHQPDIDIPTLEARVNELIRQDLPIDYYDESHILLGGAQHYCTGPRTHVRSTGRIIGFRLLDHFIYDHFHKTYMLVGCVGDDSEENIRKLETIHG